MQRGAPLSSYHHTRLARLRGLAKRALTGLAVVPLALAATWPAQAQRVTTEADVTAILPQLEAYVTEAMEAWGTPGVAIGIVAEDRLVYAKGFGVRELGSDEPVDADTVFQIGSTTKAFLGVSQALLVGEGKLAWTNRVIDHDPAFRLADPWVTREFRLADLLAQRSGLPYSTLTNMMLYGYERDAVIKALRHVEPVASFRSVFAYQNAFHLVAERIVARTAGTATWEEFLQQRLLDPLGMTSTSYTAEAIEQAPNHARGHRYDGRTTVDDPFGVMPYDAGGAGNLNSTLRDLSRWVRFHINGGEIDGTRLIEREILAATYEPRIALSGPIAKETALSDDDVLAYATGWIFHSTPQGRVIEHGGGTVGFVSHIAFDPDRRFGVIVLSNQSALIGNGLALPFGKYALDLLQGRPATDYAAASLAKVRHAVETIEAEMQPPAGAIPPRPLSAYEGSYLSPALGPVTLRAQGETLAFTLGPQRLPVTLTPWSGDIFVAHIPLPVEGEGGSVDRVKLRFVSDDSGRIERFDWLGEGDADGQPPFRRVEAGPAQ